MAAEIMIKNFGNRSYLKLTDIDRKSKCIICEKEFIKQSGIHKYCSEICKGKAKYIFGVVTTESQYQHISGNWERYFNRLRNQKGRQSLSLDNLLEIYNKQNGLCALSGQPLTCVLSKGSICKTNASIDKIKPSEGYKKENIQLVCRALNSWRGDTNLEEFIWWCEQVSLFQRGKE